MSNISLRLPKYLLFIIFVFLLSGCANQQPPGGGEEDTIPPKIKIVEPRSNAVNFRGRTLEFEFSEYVDRRSFQDAFRISPALKGEIEFNWGTTNVEVVFPGDLQVIEPNKTFVVNISTALADLHGVKLTAPVTFAFSTGPVIDKGIISGSTYNIEKKTISIFAYRIEDESKYDPAKNIPDYLTETSQSGIYELTNLAAGKYRVISVVDDDRNLFYSSDLESFGVLPYDIDLPDSGRFENADFYMKKAAREDSVATELDYTKYFKDSAGIVYTSVEYDSRIVAPDQSIYFFFNRHKPARDEFVNSLKITGEDNREEKVVFNWRNDSLVEVFAAEKFKPNFKYSISLPLKVSADSVYNYSWKFRTVGKNSFGEIKGSVRSEYENIDLFNTNIKVELASKGITPPVKYSFDLHDTVFAFANILESEYALFSYIDLNVDNAYGYGNPHPFSFSEPFFIYPGAIRIRGGWTVENIVISFKK